MNKNNFSDQLLNYHYSNDQDDQLDMIEEEINIKVKCIKDLKELNKVQQMTDEQIFNADICDICGWKKECKRCLAFKQLQGGE